MDKEAWRAAWRGVVKSRAQLSDWTELNWDALEVGMWAQHIILQS